MAKKTMQAFLVEKPHQFGLVEVEVPSIDPNEVLLKVGSSGICGSDLDVLVGSRPDFNTRYPAILGHEFSGEIVALGSNVKNYKEGDKVAVNPLVYCGICSNCQRGWVCHCLKGYDQLGFTKPGGMAEYVAVQQKLLHQVPDDMDLSVAALAEPAGCAAHAVSKAEIKPGDSVVVIGCGPIGALVLQIAKMFSPQNLILIEINERKLEAGKELGASHAINSEKEDTIAKVREITNNQGADAVIECAGSITALQQSFSYIATKARIVLIGSLDKEKFEISYLSMLENDVTFRVNNGFTAEIWCWALDLLINGCLVTEPIITHRLILENIEKGLRILKDKDEHAIKVMISG